MTQADLPEQRRADAAAAVVESALYRREAKRALAEATAGLRKDSIAAIQAGCTYRRVRDLAGVSLQTLVNWVKEDGQ